jgi:CDP-paratose 2-epimerase
VSTAIVTGSGGLIGAESVSRLVEGGFHVVGLENDMRAHFFGPDASTAHVTESLRERYPEFESLDVDIRDADGVDRVFGLHARDLELVVHTAAQPSHDWAATDPQTDFGVNATATLNLLEATRRHKSDATFVFTSTNKVYGDLPNGLPLVELATRLDLPHGHPYFAGVDASMQIDRSTHSLFGVSKTAADLLVQEYGRYFQMPTVCFRCGCLTGPHHAGARLHGFLAYLMKGTVSGKPYTVFGHGGKQVRDNLHCSDVVRAFEVFQQAPRVAAVYNLGGGRARSCSVLEAIELCQAVAGRELDWELSDAARVGDHRWWITDVAAFQADYPDWEPEYALEPLLREIYEHNVDRWVTVQ